MSGVRLRRDEREGERNRARGCERVKREMKRQVNVVKSTCVLIESHLPLVICKHFSLAYRSNWREGRRGREKENSKLTLTSS